MSSNRTDRLFLSPSPETNEREGEFGLHGQLQKRKKQREMARLDYRKEGKGEKIGKNTLKKRVEKTERCPNSVLHSPSSQRDSYLT